MIGFSILNTVSPMSICFFSLKKKSKEGLLFFSPKQKALDKGNATGAARVSSSGLCFFYTQLRNIFSAPPTIPTGMDRSGTSLCPLAIFRLASGTTGLASFSALECLVGMSNCIWLMASSLKWVL